MHTRNTDRIWQFGITLQKFTLHSYGLLFIYYIYNKPIYAFSKKKKSRRSLGTDDSLDSSVGSEPDRSLSQRSTMLYLPAKFTVPPPTLPFGLNSLSCAAALNTRNNSVNSIQSSSNSSTLSSTDKPMRESSPDEFDEIAMPQEGELSNLDVDWFMTYDCTLSRPEKPTA